MAHYYKTKSGRSKRRRLDTFKLLHNIEKRGNDERGIYKNEMRSMEDFVLPVINGSVFVDGQGDCGPSQCRNSAINGGSINGIGSNLDIYAS